MKNQYFGDISDYKKYSLLRALSNHGDTRIVVGWMLTEDDGRMDGKFIRYLQEPTKWRHYDPQVFDLLCNLINQKDSRNVRLLEKEDIIPGAIYYTDIITDDVKQRQQYFENLQLLAEGSHLIFLDPDNGIEVKSTLKGGKNSSK